MKLYVVCGPPAGGKTRYGRDLAVRVGAVFLDNDIATEPVVQAGMEGESKHSGQGVARQCSTRGSWKLGVAFHIL